MPKAAAANHATHDELLIARLYGDDVDSGERALALDHVAGCDECAALYADLGAIATAAAALPVQRRPRDFALTENDAARLRPRRRGLARLLAFGPRRSFGGALMALGFSGLIVTAAVSMLGPGMSPTLTSSSERYAAPQAVGAGSPNSNAQGGVAVASSAPTAAPAAIPAPATPAPAKAVESVGPPATPNASSALDLAAPTGGQAVAIGANSAGSTPGTAQGQTLTSTAPQSGPDPKQLLVAGSALALALGLAFLLLPAIRRRARGGARH